MKHARTPSLFLISFLFLISACNKTDTSPKEEFYFSEVAREYLREVLNIMQNNSINKNIIDWSSFSNDVLLEANGAETIEETYPGIEKALELLGDNHSVFFKPNGGGFSAAVFNCEIENITETSWPSEIGYVKVNAYSGAGNDALAISFATEIQEQIKNQDNDQIKGWIVDLRGNLGGNMWPMLAGIGPILGNGVAGYFKYPDGDEISWGFLNGSAMISGTTALTTINNSYELINPNNKVAVLLNNSIASSGEAIAVSFIGKENTKSFGASTCGLSTANQAFPLSDGATLNLTTSFFADRNKKTYGIPISPDVQTSNDNIMQLATDWILD